MHDSRKPTGGDGAMATGARGQSNPVALCNSGRGAMPVVTLEPRAALCAPQGPPFTAQVSDLHPAKIFPSPQASCLESS